MHQEKRFSRKFPATNYSRDAWRKQQITIKQQNAVRIANSDPKIAKTRGFTIDIRCCGSSTSTEVNTHEIYTLLIINKLFYYRNNAICYNGSELCSNPQTGKANQIRTKITELKSNQHACTGKQTQISNWTIQISNICKGFVNRFQINVTINYTSYLSLIFKEIL